MEDMESKLGAILGDPAKMAQVMELAQAYAQANNRLVTRSTHRARAFLPL